MDSTMTMEGAAMEPRPLKIPDVRADLARRLCRLMKDAYYLALNPDNTEYPGQCYAGNKFFATKYKVDEDTIRRWFGIMSDCGMVEIEIVKGTTRLVRPLIDFEALAKLWHRFSRFALFLRTKLRGILRPSPHDEKPLYTEAEKANNIATAEPAKPAVKAAPAPDPEAGLVVADLVAAGVVESIAWMLSRNYPLERCRKQLKWNPHRAQAADPARDNPAGRLVKSIVEDWPIPAALVPRTKTGKSEAQEERGRAADARVWRDPAGIPAPVDSGPAAANAALDALPLDDFNELRERALAELRKGTFTRARLAAGILPEEVVRGKMRLLLSEEERS